MAIQPRWKEIDNIFYTLTPLILLSLATHYDSLVPAFCQIGISVYLWIRLFFLDKGV